MPTPFRYGTEFLVNTTTTGSQHDSSITALADGRFVVSWTDPSQTGGDTSSNAIRAQIFNADGSAFGAEFLVNTTTIGNQTGPSITALADGRFVISWSDLSATGGDTSSWAIRAQVFNADGSTSGAEFLVNTTTAVDQLQSSITALADGRFVVSWTDESATGGDTDGYAIRAQILNADGSAFGAEFLVNTTTSSDQSLSSITALADGRFVVSWTDLSSTGGDTDGYAVRAQILNADGSAFGAEFLVNTTTSSDQFGSSITALADGRFVISWSDGSQTGGDTSSYAIRAQVFNIDGSTSGAEFLVNTTTTGTQYESSITALADGRFVISWSDGSQTGGDTSFYAMRAQVFNIDGSTSGAEFLVNTTTIGNQTGPSITALADGRFVVSWTDDSATGGDASGYAIRAQIFDPRDSLVVLHGTTLDDDFVGTRFGDQISGFLGDDNLQGGGGDDDLFGEQGDDTLNGGHGNDRLYGDIGADFLIGGIGSDQLYGGDGNDRLNGGFGIDYMVGGTGNDTYFVDILGDFVVELTGGGTDFVRSANMSLDLANYANVENLALLGSANLDVTGNVKFNVLLGNAGDNLISGFGGNDTLNGLAGADILIGGTGRDIMLGGADADTFVYLDIGESVAGSARDIIGDFNQAQGDLIDLSAIDARLAAGDQAFIFLGTVAFPALAGTLRYFQSGAATFVQADLDGDGNADFEIRVNGLHTLTVADFIL